MWDPSSELFNFNWTNVTFFFSKEKLKAGFPNWFLSKIQNDYRAVLSTLLALSGIFYCLIENIDIKLELIW